MSARIELWTVYGIGCVQAEQIDRAKAEEFSLQAQRAKIEINQKQRSQYQGELLMCWALRHSSHFWKLLKTFFEALSLGTGVSGLKEPWIDISWIPLCYKSSTSAYELVGFEDWGLVEQFLSLEDPLVSNPQELVFILEFEMEARTLLGLFFP